MKWCSSMASSQLFVLEICTKTVLPVSVCSISHTILFEFKTTMWMCLCVLLSTKEVFPLAWMLPSMMRIENFGYKFYVPRFSE